jgi:hypothetical protein
MNSRLNARMIGVPSPDTDPPLTGPALDHTVLPKLFGCRS